MTLIAGQRPSAKSSRCMPRQVPMMMAKKERKLSPIVLAMMAARTFSPLDGGGASRDDMSQEYRLSDQLSWGSGC